MPQKRGSMRRAKLAVAPCLSLFDLPEDREREREKGRKGKEKKEKKASTYTPRSLTPDRPPLEKRMGRKEERERRRKRERQALIHPGP